MPGLVNGFEYLILLIGLGVIGVGVLIMFLLGK
jgi:hypothetical protein